MNYYLVILRVTVIIIFFNILKVEFLLPGMKQETLEELEKQLEKRAKTREIRKKRKMAVSGKSVFGLQKIIRRKAS